MPQGEHPITRKHQATASFFLADLAKPLHSPPKAEAPRRGGGHVSRWAATAGLVRTCGCVAFGADGSGNGLRGSGAGAQVAQWTAGGLRAETHLDQS